jgi:hypothetical protein
MELNSKSRMHLKTRNSKTCETLPPHGAGFRDARFVGRGHPGSGFWITTLVLLLGCGCVSKKAAKEQARRTFEAGVQQGQKSAEMNMTHVFLRGPVQKPVIPWHEGLTVAQAIVEAVYTSQQAPMAITIRRKGRNIPVNPTDLLQGVNPPVEAGDLIELH